MSVFLTKLLHNTVEELGIASELKVHLLLDSLFEAYTYGRDHGWEHEWDAYYSHNNTETEAHLWEEYKEFVQKKGNPEE